MKLFKTMLFSTLLAFSSAMYFEVQAQPKPKPNITKLAKDFGVSPKLLQKFRKAGMKASDISDGLKISQQVSKLKNIDIGDAVEQVLGQKLDGKEWSDIAKQFDVELPVDVKVPKRK